MDTPAAVSAPVHSTDCAAAVAGGDIVVVAVVSAGFAVAVSDDGVHEDRMFVVAQRGARLGGGAVLSRVEIPRLLTELSWAAAVTATAAAAEVQYRVQVVFLGHDDRHGPGGEARAGRGGGGGGRWAGR